MNDQTSANMAKQAAGIANDLLDQGYKCIAILFPDSKWYIRQGYAAVRTTYAEGCGSQESGLKSLPLDALICVDSAAIPERALAYATERLRACPNPREIHLIRSAPPESV
jgi:hypothetical protein